MTGRARSLAEVNADIAALDAYLGRSALRHVLEADIPGAFGESVSWCLAEPPKRWRLVHVVRGGARTVLAEAPERVRIRAMRALPDLVRQAGDLARELVAMFDADETEAA